MVCPEEGAPLANGGRLYLNGKPIAELKIPEGVTSIGQYAFFLCSGLTAVHITDIAKWCGVSFGGSSANPLGYAHKLYLNLNKAVGITRRVRVGQFQLPYVLPAA